MKTRFYCVNIEFYDSGKAMACMTSGYRRGRSYYRQVPGMSAFKMYWVNEAVAVELVQSIMDGSIELDDVLSVWSDFKDYEDVVWYKGVAA